jgi:hypothetical protein
MLYLNQPMADTGRAGEGSSAPALGDHPTNPTQPPEGVGCPEGPPEGDPHPSSLETSETTDEPLPWQTRSQYRIHAPFTKPRRRIFWSLDRSSDAALRRRAARISECCKHPEVRIGAEGQVSVFAPRCRDRLCPLCSLRRSREAAARTKEAAARMDSPKHLVLTAPHTDEPLRDHLRCLREALKKLRSSQEWKRHVAGGVYAFEITRNERTGKWHPHVHVLMDAGYWAQRDICIAWGRALRATDAWADYPEHERPVVYVSAVMSRSKVATYIAKYVTKPAELGQWDDDIVCEYATAVAGARMLHTFGSLHGTKLDPRDPNKDLAVSTHACYLGWLDRLADEGDEAAQYAVALVHRLIPRCEGWTAYQPPPLLVARASECVAPNSHLAGLVSLIQRGKAASPANEMRQEAAVNHRADPCLFRTEFENENENQNENEN